MSAASRNGISAWQRRAILAAVTLVAVAALVVLVIRLTDPAVEGRVCDENGRPIAGARVRYKLIDGTSRSVGVGEDGRFRVVPPERGAPVKVAASLGEGTGEDEAWADVKPGEKDVLFVIDLTTTLTVRLEGSDAPAHVSLVRNGRRERDARPRRLASATGWVFEDLDRSARYDVFAWVPDDGAYGILRDAAPGEGVQSVQLAPGDALAGRVSAPEGVSAQDVWVQATKGGLVVGAPTGADGTFRMKGLPAGTWSLSATTRAADGTTYRAEGSAHTETDAVLELRPVK